MDRPHENFIKFWDQVESQRFWTAEYHADDLGLIVSITSLSALENISKADFSEESTHVKRSSDLILALAIFMVAIVAWHGMWEDIEESRVGGAKAVEEAEKAAGEAKAGEK
ncbi:hypothetical protein MMC20_005598 [Loxospora ochrophaea]|nr:hypothetical protein [Loxospora ochrophaea]